MKNIPLFLLLLFVQWAGAQVTVVTNPDGTTFTAVANNGASSIKYDIVFIGDGFRESEQTAFNNAVTDAVQALRNLPPYRGTMCALNIWRVNVVSAQSGCDHPAQGTSVNTALDCTFGNPALGQAERCIQSASPAKCMEAAGHAPAADAIFVLVNDAQWGGCAGNLVFSSIAPGFANIITHELGHKIGSLADEYSCYVCDGSDPTAYTGPEPTRDNLTKNSNLATVKWHRFVTAGGAVGLFEGGGYRQTGIYRPQSNCQMRSSSQPFCAVCNHRVDSILRSKCTRCELSVRDCISIGDIRDLQRIRFVWERPFRWPWPPVCLTCPPFKIRTVDVILEGLNIKDYDVAVLNSNEERVGQVTQSGKGVAVKFTQATGEKYFLQVTLKNKSLALKEVALQVKGLQR